MSLYENMLPKEAIKGKFGYYPVTNSKEWDDLPDLYKVMQWELIKDPHNNFIAKAVKSVIFNVTFLEPYGINAKVSVHPSDVQKILFCSYEDTSCLLHSVSGLELEGGTKVSAKWLQDSESGAFAIVTAGGDYAARQGGYRGFIPEHVKRLENGSFKYDFDFWNGKICHYEISNPFSHLEKKMELSEKQPLSEKIQDAQKRKESAAGLKAEPEREL